MIAAFAAPTPASALLVALLLAGVACLGAGVAPALYLRAAAPAVGFLGLSGLTLLLAIDSDFSWRWAPGAWPRVAALTARSLAALAALLGLVLPTPLPDLSGLLRRLRCPALLLDLMVLCYRMLFVFSAALHDTATAQRARLGYASPRLARRSLGLLAANLTLQVWHRAQGLHRAALARNGDGALRLLSPEFAHARRDTACAAVAGALLVILARLAA